MDEQALVSVGKAEEAGAAVGQALDAAGGRTAAVEPQAEGGGPGRCVGRPDEVGHLTAPAAGEPRVGVQEEQPWPARQSGAGLQLPAAAPPGGGKTAAGGGRDRAGLVARASVDQPDLARYRLTQRFETAGQGRGGLKGGDHNAERGERRRGRSLPLRPVGHGKAQRCSATVTKPREPGSAVKRYSLPSRTMEKCSGSSPST